MRCLLFHSQNTICVYAYIVRYDGYHSFYVDSFLEISFGFISLSRYIYLYFLWFNFMSDYCFATCFT